MANPLAPLFISYRHSRVAEARLLVEALKEVGVPVWIDTDDLGAARTERVIRELLAGDAVSGAILYLTPDVAGSDFIPAIEIPRIFERDRADDDFWVLPIAAGGLSPQTAPAVAGPAHDIGSRNILTVAEPLTPREAARVAAAALRNRVAVIHRRTPEDQPLEVRLFTRGMVAAPDIALVFDWRHHWPANEPPSPQTWEQRLLPALDVTRDAVAGLTGRAIDAGGLPAISAAVALGVAFAAPHAIGLCWRQAGSGSDIWSLHGVRDSRLARDRGWTIEVDDGSALASTDVAVVVNVTHDARPAVAASPTVPPLRGTVVVDHADAIAAQAADGERPDWIYLADSEEAASVAYLARAAVNRTRQRYPTADTVHLFLAGPAGLAVLVGQLMNTVHRLHTYEHRGTGYLPAATLRP